MKYFQYLLSLVIMVSCQSPDNLNHDLKPPSARKIDKELTTHGHTRIDPYYWLKERENQEVINYLNAENDYTNQILKHTSDFQKKLFDEIVGRIKQKDESVPYKSNGYWYYRRFEEGQEYPIHCRKEGSLDALEEILLNVNEMASGYKFFRVTGLRVSINNEWLAYGVDTVSRRKYTLYFKNLKTGSLVQESIPNTTGSCTWANDNQTLFYTSKDPKTLRPNRIYRHSLNTLSTEDKEIYYESDDTFTTYVYKTKSNKFIAIASQSTLSTEYRILNADQPLQEFSMFQPREKKLEYSLAHYQDKFYILTNWEATNFRLMQTPDHLTNKENWQEVIPHREEVLIEKIEVFKNFLVMDERTQGSTQLRIINQATREEHYLEFEEPAYTAWISTNREFDTPRLRFGYESMTTPESIFEYHMDNKQRKLIKQKEVLGEFDPKQYTTDRLFATSRDGKMVPVSLVYRNDQFRQGNNPLLLYAYGSYGSTLDAYFSSVRLSLLNRGFVFAMAHVRGGQMLGRPWYEDGKMFNKKNTFYDFIDCAEYLAENGFANPDKMYAMGGSAGGLLIGAVVNLRPGLFQGVIAEVPFVDVMTTMLDTSIPLTTGEYSEWGNPNEKASYEYMLSYSPYDNVEVKDYPHILITAGLHDSQVQYWEPAKWVAKLRDLKTDNNRLLLFTNMEAGHGGASGRFEIYREVALEYAFILDLEGINQ